MKKTITPYMFVGLAIFLLLIFNFYPIFQTIYLSFMTQQRGVLVFTGISNYKRLLSDQIFWLSLKNSLIYLVIQVPIMTSLALIVATLLHRGITYGKGLFRTLYFIPVVVDAVAYSLIFMLIFQERGIVNFFLSFFNIEAIPWIRQPWSARIVIMTVMTWRWMGYNMVMFLAGLQAIPEDLYEAARLDGAGPVRSFLSITLPALRPVILFSLVLSTNGTLNLFSEPYLLTSGGPNNSTLSIGLYIYRQAFNSFDLTYSATISIAVIIIVAILVQIQMRIGKES
ncbi:MAG: carbohydrate ABC transporter permease [Brevinema sp.]